MSATTPTEFPSVEWFQRLADLMNGNRARQEQLGYVDCVCGFRITDGAQTLAEIHVTFDEFEATSVRAADESSPGEVDFVLEASLAIWREMIENIRSGDGRPDLEHTLNRLSNMGTPISLEGDDMLRKDLYFRYNQSLQEFFNASTQVPTVFP